MVALVVAVSMMLERFLRESMLPTPFLVLDPEVVAARYTALRWAFGDAGMYFAVKACPEPAVLRLLAALGCGFDVASPAEVHLACAAGAPTEALCYGNPIRGVADVDAAYAAGVRRYVTDSAEDVAVLSAQAPGARVLVRLLVSEQGAATPFHGKFGATGSEAARLLEVASRAGLVAEGVAFHVGSQQPRPAAFTRAVGQALAVAAAAGLRHPVLNVGGGFPVSYRDPVPGPEIFAAAIATALRGAVRAGVVAGARLILEPGRVLVAEAGVLRAGVLRVSRRVGVDDRRWVYLDVGRYRGLAETEAEAITYPMRAPGRTCPCGPVVIAGPSCDGDDVLYRRTPYSLPLALRGGDVVELLATGAYTASYSSVGFNGFAPLPVHVL